MWLIRHFAEPDSSVVSLFAGSGSTGLASITEGFSCLSFDRDCSLVEARFREFASVYVKDRLCLSEMSQEHVQSAQSVKDMVSLFIFKNVMCQEYEYDFVATKHVISAESIDRAP
jgi:hypothetical protein